jgi:hypothetical protein
MAALIFISAANLNYWQAWLFLAVYFTCSLAITLYLMNKDPALLQRRMRGGPTAERKTTQKIIMALASTEGAAPFDPGRLVNRGLPGRPLSAPVHRKS